MGDRLIGDVASEVGVSPQTLRVWEKQDLLIPDRTAGGQRRYTPDQVERARRIAGLRRQYGWNPAAIRNSLDEAEPSRLQPPKDGYRLRRARQARGWSLSELAEQVGVSASHLSSIERGLDKASTQLIARITDALGIPMSGLAPFHSENATVVRRDERASVVLSGGVQWEELVLPGHELEPALLTIPPRESSGGAYSRPSRAFAFVLSGTVRVTMGSSPSDDLTPAGSVDAFEGDSISLPAHTLYSWENPGEEPARLLWVEALSAHAWADPMTKRILKAASQLPSV